MVLMDKIEGIDLYFIQVQINPFLHICQDESIANYIGIEVEEYREKCIEGFNGFRNISDYICYGEVKDIEKAREWIESLLIGRKLRGR